MQLSMQYIRERSKDALHVSAQGNPRNACDVVSNELSYGLELELDVELPDEVYAPVDGRKHFVAVIPAALCAFGGETGFVIVDATLTQFQDMFDVELPEVVVLPPGDPRRSTFYDSIRLPA